VGIKASHVLELDFLARDDQAIFAEARAANAVVVTKDDDFVQLLDRLGAPPQVVWVTCGNVKNAELRRIILSAWPRIAELLAGGEQLVEVGELQA
jgi:predicted nuclease of predicted toxin-antitoxin system